MSINEEFQSTNEELETSKEELQSVNEELNTLNTELSEKVSELMEANNDLDNLFNATEIATVFLDAKLRIKRFTPSATGLLSLVPSDCGRLISDIRQGFAPDLLGVVQQVLDSQLPASQEIQIKDGRWFTMRVLPYRTHERPVDGIVVTFSEVTLLKQAEVVLQEAKSYAEHIIETIRVPLVVLDEQLRVRSVNAAFCRLFKTDAAHVAGLPIFQVSGGGQWDIPELQKLLQEIVPNRSRFDDFEVSREFGPLGPRTMLLHARHIEQPDRAGLVLLAIEDISERKAAQRALEVTSANLARSNKDLEQFAYVASHDLQEPLRMVTGFMKLLQQKYVGQLDPKAQEYIATASDGASRMSKLISDLLAFSRVGRIVQENAVVDMETVMANAQRSLTTAIAESDAVVTHDPLPSVLGNAMQLTQLLQNLIGNAVKFHAAGVTPQVHVAAKQKGNQWAFSVRDNGIGIPQEQQDRVFMIFQRLHSSAEYAGTGIGLAICKKIVESHGGRICFESEPGKGTTFHFTLPCKPEKPAKQ